MPDIQTALAQALEQWNQPETTTMTSSTPEPINNYIKNNVSRATFNFIRDNPGLTKADVVHRLLVQGYRKSSVSSLIAQFIRDSQITYQSNKLYAVGTEYRILPQSKKRKSAKKVVAVKPQAAPVVVEEAKAPAQLVRRPMPSFNAQEMVNRWSAYQAREVYQELKSIFGG